MTPTFGIFDHIADIPGTSTQRILQGRLALVKDADAAGFTSFHLAEHHGSGLCLAPTQEIFIAAASQITNTIRFGPMVKLLPEQIAERFAGVLEPGYVDHIALQVPTGDMTYDEARRTVDLFGAEVMPVLEKQFAG